MNQKSEIDFSQFNQLIKYYSDYLNREYANVFKGRGSKHSLPAIKNMHQTLKNYNTLANNVQDESQLAKYYMNLQREMQRYNVL